MIIEVSTEVSTYHIEDPEQDWYDDVPYSYRGETGTQLDNVTAAVSQQDISDLRTSWGESLVKDMPGVAVGDYVYVVVATYQSGDTFGLDGGHTKVLDAFTTTEEAKSLKTKAEEVDTYQFFHEGREYYAPWIGYFERLESVTMWAVQVKPHHDYRFGR